MCKIIGRSLLFFASSCFQFNPLEFSIVVCLFLSVGFVFSFCSSDMFADRVFVSTWNVAGKSPPNCLNVEDWLHASPPADIYVLGYIPKI